MLTQVNRCLIFRYGISFACMPALSWKLGYPAVLASRLFVAGGIYVWFRRKAGI